MSQHPDPPWKAPVADPSGAAGSALPDATEFTQVLVDAGVLRMEPGDVLVIHSKEKLRDCDAVRLRETAKSFAPPGTKVAVLDAGLELIVLRPTQTTAAPADV